MTWFKFDDNAVDHPKVASLSDRAFRWWIRGLSYASRYLTDGVLHPVFWKKVHKNDRAELTGNHLWDWVDPNFQIHDYHKHQSLKEEVEADKERSRANAKAYRERRKSERRQQSVIDSSSMTGGSAVIDESSTQRTDTENREQRTEIRDQRTTKSERGGGIIMSPLQFARLQETHSFIGAKLRVPHALHSELIAKSGSNADVELRAWYARLDEELELSGKATGDVFAWLRPRHQAFAIERGWIDPAPSPKPQRPVYRGIAAILADEEARKKAGVK